ncbi:MAG: 3-deoxy-manno-octulosonate cytidylyltransferase [Saprospiraceae bacterium]|nr:3-deoxy-manno-octulosonate cytidylyltransferase [Saprospiraceae bacterium]
MKTICIIPARFQSNRLPGKVLKDIHGQSMLQRVFQKAKEAQVFDGIIIATDHQKIVDHCTTHDMPVVLTSTNHISGTDRIAEVAKGKDAEIVINIQADEPFIEVHCIQSLVTLMKESEVQIGTLYKSIKNQKELFDYNVVKLVKNKNNKILYFSRQAIPALRDEPYKNWFSKTDYYQHLGLYGFKKKYLLKVVALSPSTLELTEKLEQLRWLENGYEIFGAEVASDSFGIDTLEDLEKARDFYK